MDALPLGQKCLFQVPRGLLDKLRLDLPRLEVAP
jgi:hypothetical protein